MLLAGLGVVVVDDPAGERLFLVGVEQRRFVDLTQVQLQTGLDGNGSHKFSFPPTGAASKPQVADAIAQTIRPRRFLASRQPGSDHRIVPVIAAAGCNPPPHGDPTGWYRFADGSDLGCGG